MTKITKDSTFNCTRVVETGEDFTRERELKLSYTTGRGIMLHVWTMKKKPWSHGVTSEFNIFGDGNMGGTLLPLRRFSPKRFEALGKALEQSGETFQDGMRDWHDDDHWDTIHRKAHFAFLAGKLLELAGEVPAEGAAA